MNLLGRHLTGLFDFGGRENRQPFWLWILIVYGFQFIVGMIVMIPMMIGMFDGMATLARGDQTYIHDHPEIVNRMMMQSMGPMMHNVMLFSAAMAVVWAVLIGAAVVRRLHDGDRSGWWAAPLFAFHVAMPIAYMSVLPKFFATFGEIRPDMSPDQVNATMLPMMQEVMPLSLLGMVGFVLMILIIVFCALPGTVGPNRFGEDPLGGMR